METNPEQMFEISPEHQFDNKENVVLRSMTGDPNRYTPLVEHQPPPIFPQQKQPASMYTLESRYRPIPPEVLPKTTDPRVYYIDSNRTEESPIINKNQQIPPPMQPETQSMVPVAFLEPKVISQPVFYSIAGTRTPSIPIDQPIPINKEPPTPTVYSISGRPRRPTIDMSVNNLEAPPPAVTDKSPTLYSVVGGSRLQNQYQEPPNQPLQRPANFYSIINSPARTSRGVQVDTLDPIQPLPILYTVVGDTPLQTDRSKEKHQSTIIKQPKDATVYTLGNAANAPKAQQKQQHPKDVTVYTLDNEANALKARQQQPVPQPTLYALVNKPNSPPRENRAKPPVRKKSPPTTVTTRRVSRSLERKPEVINEEVVSYPITKTKESKVTKSETIFIPVNQQEQRTRSQQPPAPIYTNPEQTQRKPYAITPYTNRSTKPYRERKYNNDPLPVVSNNNSERKTRPPLYEPRYRPEQRQPYTTIKPTSLERYPVDTKPRSNLWDNGYQTQTDDDEEYEQRMNKKKRIYKTTRPRAPWIPVW